MLAMCVYNQLHLVKISNKFQKNLTFPRTIKYLSILILS